MVDDVTLSQLMQNKDYHSIFNCFGVLLVPLTLVACTVRISSAGNLMTVLAHFGR